MAIAKYNTIADYPNQSGFNQIAYPVRDAITIINPFFALLFLVLIVFTVGGYFSSTALTGKTRFLNSLLASSFSVFVISVFFSLAEWITPYHVLTFIGITVIAYIAATFYK